MPDDEDGGEQNLFILLRKLKKTIPRVSGTTDSALCLLKDMFNLQLLYIDQNFNVLFLQQQQQRQY